MMIAIHPIVVSTKQHRVMTNSSNNILSDVIKHIKVEGFFSCNLMNLMKDVLKHSYYFTVVESDCPFDNSIKCLSNDACIPRSFLCDGAYDCDDRSDEIQFCGEKCLTL